MAVPQSIGNFPNLRDIGDILLNVFDLRYGVYDPIYPKYFNVETGTRATENMLSLVGPTQMEQIAFGQATPFVDALEGYKTPAAAQKWARGLEFVEEAIKFDMSKRLGRMADKFARNSNYAAEVEAARVINAMITTNHPDTGQPLVSASQPLKRTGGTFSNRVSADIGVATLDSILVQFAKQVDDNNELINIMPKYIVHTPDDGRVVRQLLQSDGEPYTADRQANDFKGKLQAIQNPFLTDADSGVVVAAPEENGLFYVEWQGTRRKAWVDNDADVLKFKVTRIMKAVFADWRGLIGYIGV